MNLFGERLRELRGDRTKAEFARQMGIASQVNYGRYEAGRIPDPEILCDIANRNGCTIDWLLGRTDERKPPMVLKESSASYQVKPVAEVSGASVEELFESLSELLDQARAARGVTRKMLVRSIRDVVATLEHRLD